MANVESSTDADASDIGAARPVAAEPVNITCRDGVALGGHLWRRNASQSSGSIIINPATGVLATLLSPLCPLPG
jgi:predicted alpha/beta hydrolase